MTQSLWVPGTASEDAIAATGSGDLWLSPSLMAVVSPDEAWTGLRDLHFAALGDTGYRYETNAMDMLPEEARAAYSSATLAVMGQLASISPDASNSLLESMCDFADGVGGFDGLDGPAMTAFLGSTGAEQFSPGQDQFQLLVAGLGLPGLPGGGFDTTAVLDRLSNQLGFPEAGQLEHLAARAGGQPTEFLINEASKLVGRGVGEVASAVGLDGKAFGEAASHLGAAAGGAVLGAEIGSIFGPVGTVVGGLIGFFAGLFGGDSEQQTHRNDAAKDAAAGVQVTVHIDIKIEINGQQQVVNKHGECKPAPSGAHNPDSPPQMAVLEPPKDRCPVDDELIPGEYQAPYWAELATLAGTAVVSGDGMSGLYSTFPTANAGAGFRLAELPQVDQAGIMSDGGAFLELVDLQLRPDVIDTGLRTLDPWALLKTGLQELVPQRTTTVVVPQLVVQLARLGIQPEDTVAEALRRIHRMYGH